MEANFLKTAKNKYFTYRCVRKNVLNFTVLFKGKLNFKENVDKLQFITK